MTMESMISLFIGVALLAAKPGPGVMTVSMKAMSEGLRPVLCFMVGTNLVKIFFFCLVVFGFHTVEGNWLFVSLVLKALAAVYLIWTGIRGLQHFEVAEANEAGLNKSGFLQNFTAGFMLTISNPLDILFFAGILPSLFNLSALGTPDFVLAALIIVAADSLIALSYAIPLSLSRHFVTPQVLRKINTASSIGIILIGLYIGYTALPGQASAGIPKTEISESID